MEKNTTDKWTVLFVASLASFLTPFMGSSVNVALPSIGKDFKIDAIILSWIATSYLLSSAIFLVPLGKLADIYLFSSSGNSKAAPPLMAAWIIKESQKEYLCQESISIASNYVTGLSASLS